METRRASSLGNGSELLALKQYDLLRTPQTVVGEGQPTASSKPEEEEEEEEEEASIPVGC
jgi:hypothetical protein